MTHSPIFVLHDSAKEEQVQQIIQALAPLMALATPFASVRESQFGPGAVCVVLWTPGLSEHVMDLLPVLRGAEGRTIVCCPHGVEAPPAFASAGFTIVRFMGEPNEDAETLRQAMQNAKHAAASVSRFTSPAQQTNNSHGFRRLAARSAVGLAATLAMVAIVGQLMQAQSAQSAAHRPSMVEAKMVTEEPALASADPSPAFEAGLITNVAAVDANHPVATPPRSRASPDEPTVRRPAVRGPARTQAPSPSADGEAIQARIGAGQVSTALDQPPSMTAQQVTPLTVSGGSDIALPAAETDGAGVDKSGSDEGGSNAVETEPTFGPVEQTSESETGAR